MLKNAEKNVRDTSYFKGQAPSIQAHTFVLPHFFPYPHQYHATKPNVFPISNKCKLEVSLFYGNGNEPGLNAPASNATYL